MQYVIVDAFSQGPFSGNPAAVCLLERALPDQRLQQLAAEFNLPETAYLLPTDANRWSLRWFTPTTEVNLCGHATLAAGHVLLTERTKSRHFVSFETRSGELTVARKDALYRMKLPATSCTPLPTDALPEPLAPLAIDTALAGEDWLMELPSEQAVRNFSPPLAVIAALPARGLIVTARGESCDFVSRFFAPAAGIDEDPVTGSAHCALANYWHNKLGQPAFRARQLSARGGELEVELVGESAWLTGAAVTVMSGRVQPQWLT